MIRSGQFDMKSMNEMNLRTALFQSRLGRLGLVLACLIGGSSDSRAQQPFVDQAVTRGLFLPTSFGYSGPLFGYGVALNDLDVDGDLDLIATGTGFGDVMVFENVGAGFFTDRTPGSGLPIGLAYSGVSCADYDGDSDLDLYISGFGTENRLLRNDGGFVFTDETDNAGVGGVSTAETNGSAWGDFDGDGWLDLYVVNITGALTLSPDKIDHSPASNRLKITLE